jgi:hypothetical protein
MPVITHTKGDVRVQRYELLFEATPKPTPTWFPVPHSDVAEAVTSTLESRGFAIQNESWILAKRGLRLFGVLDLSVPLTRNDAPGKGATISIGVRSSFDKKIPLGIVAGSRVMVCSNLAFSGEISYKRRHTRNGLNDFRRQIEESIDRIPAFQSLETARFESWMNHELSQTQADALVLALFESGIIGLRQFKPVIDELRKPSFEDFAGRLTVWSLFNRITTGLRNRAEQRGISHASETSQIIRAMNEVIETTARVRTESLLNPMAIESSND